MRPIFCIAEKDKIIEFVKGVMKYEYTSFYMLVSKSE